MKNSGLSRDWVNLVIATLAQMIDPAVCSKVETFFLLSKLPWLRKWKAARCIVWMQTWLWFEANNMNANSFLGTHDCVIFSLVKVDLRVNPSWKCLFFLYNSCLYVLSIVFICPEIARSRGLPMIWSQTTHFVRHRHCPLSVQRLPLFVRLFQVHGSSVHTLFL